MYKSCFLTELKENLRKREKVIGLDVQLDFKVNWASFQLLETREGERKEGKVVGDEDIRNQGKMAIEREERCKGRKTLEYTYIMNNKTGHKLKKTDTSHFKIIKAQPDEGCKQSCRHWLRVSWLLTFCLLYLGQTVAPMRVLSLDHGTHPFVSSPICDILQKLFPLVFKTDRPPLWWDRDAPNNWKH